MKRPKAKKVSYHLIPRTDDLFGGAMYGLLDELVEQHHEDLRFARIALAWCTSWNPDVDGRVILGKCRKASDLDRELAAFDFVILLRKAFWTHLSVSDAQRRALLDHELCHAALKLDVNGEPVEDERGRRVYRVRKHDLEEFVVVVERHGMYTRDLEVFAAALRRAVAPKFRPCEACASTPGWVAVTEHGIARVTRCACWTAWAEQLAEAV
jgi:Putative phage metallopeptidase